jgi:lipopolysaccharide biosynthesis glycosyltransferase
MDQPALPPLVFAINDAYCLPTTVAWESICASNPDLVDRLRVMVLTEHLEPRSLEQLRSHADRLRVDLEVITVELPDLPYRVDPHASRASYLRLTMATALAGYNRVVYLDADVVVQDDLRPLMFADLGDNAIGAIVDPMNPTYELSYGLPCWREMGIPGDRDYFNSGVFVMDLDTCARHDVFGKAFRVVAGHSADLRFLDQDALNVAVDDRWVRLPRRWNTPPLSALPIPTRTGPDRTNRPRRLPPPSSSPRRRPPSSTTCHR